MLHLNTCFEGEPKKHFCVFGAPVAVPVGLWLSNELLILSLPCTPFFYFVLITAFLLISHIPRKDAGLWFFECFGLSAPIPAQGASGSQALMQREKTECQPQGSL